MNNPKHWILIGGPPSSGKDTLTKGLIRFLQNDYISVNHIKFSQPLKDGVKGFFALTQEQYEWCENPQNKNTKIDLLAGLSWRQAQIDLAEILVRPNWGKDVFVKIAANKANQMPLKEVIIVSDLGFSFERDWFIDNMEYANCNMLDIVSLYRDNTSYEGDSRERVLFTQKQLDKAPSLRNFEVENNDTPNGMVYSLVKKGLFDKELG